jgi:protein-disulfide isomerase
VLTVEPQVVEQYVRPGKVRLIFRNVLSYGERSERTGEAAASAGQQGQFWQMHELLFEEQSAIESKSGDALLQLMKDFAARLPGLDQAAFAKSMDERATLAAIKAADEEQRRRGITSQPIFEIGEQRLFGFQSFEVLQRAIEAALKA